MIKPDEWQVPYYESQIEELERELTKTKAQLEIAVNRFTRVSESGSDITCRYLARQALSEIKAIGDEK